MCGVKPSVLLNVYPWSSKAGNAEAEELVVILMGYISKVCGDRWLHEMDEKERGDVYEYAQGIAARMRLTLGDVSVAVDALSSPFAAAAFSDDWRKALERAYFSSKEV